MSIAAGLLAILTAGDTENVRPPSEMELKAINMRYHELKALEYERGSMDRQYHENRATQYRDELLGNPPNHR